MIVKADISDDIVYNYKKPDKEDDDTYPEGYGLKKVTINFDSIYSYDEARARGLTGLRNTAAYMADEDVFGDAKYWSGETDAPTGDAHKESLGAVREDLRDLMNDLDTARDLPNTVYAGADMNITEVDSSALSNIKKHVTATGYDKWAYGYETPINVYEGGKYTYRITLTADSDTTTSDIIILDDLEYYKPVRITGSGDSGVAVGKVMSRREFEATNEILVNSGNAPMTGVEVSGWKGHFRSVNVSEIQSMGVDVKVYYCTDNTRVDSLNPDHTVNTVGNYIEANWSLTPPDDLDDVTAIAIDCRKDTYGAAFELHEGEELIAYVNMIAPTYEEWSEIFADADYDDYRNNWKAYNNVYMDITQVDKASNRTHSYDHFDYTEIGIYGGRLEIEKVWDDTDDNDKIRPASASGKILGNGEDTGKTFLIDEEHPKTIIEHIPLYTPDGDEIYYEALENPVDGYESQSRIVRNGNNFKLVITNKHELIKTELPVEKFWASDTEGDEWKNYIPNAVTVELYAKYPGSETATSTGKRMTLLKARDWKDTFTDLQKYKDGEEIEYSVKEVAFSDDWASVSEGGTVTNTYHPYGNLKVTKHCEDTTEVNADKEFIFTLSLTEEDGSGHVGKYDYEIKKNNEIISTGKIGDGNEFKLKDGEEIFIKDIPSKISYKISETGAPGFNVSDKTGDMGKITSNKTSESEFTNTYYSRGSYSLKATKNLTGTALTRGRFRFEVYDADGKKLRTASNQENGDVLFGNFNFTNADHNKTFTYKIKEVNTNKPGYTYDDTEYTVNLTPVDNGDGTMTVTCDTDMEDIVFNNEYHADGEVTLKAWKQLQGRDLTAGEFEFVLKDEDGNVVQAKTNDADGKIVFDALQFNETHVGNTYIYTVEEKKGDDETVNYDDTVHGYSIYVVDNGDGTLSFTQSAVDMENYWIETTAGEYFPNVLDNVESYPDFIHWSLILDVNNEDNNILLPTELYQLIDTDRTQDKESNYEYTSLGVFGKEVYLTDINDKENRHRIFHLSEDYTTYNGDTDHPFSLFFKGVEEAGDGDIYPSESGDNFGWISIPKQVKLTIKNPDWQPTEVNTAPVFTNSLKDGELSLTKRTINSTDPNKKFKFRIKVNSDNLDNLKYEYTNAEPLNNGNNSGNEGHSGKAVVDGNSSVNDGFTTPTLNHEIPEQKEKSLLDRIGDAFNAVKEVFTGETVEAAIVDWTEVTTGGSSFKWMIDDDGVLHIAPISGDTALIKDVSSSSSGAPWYSNRSQITNISSTGNVVLEGSAVGLFYGCSGLTNLEALSNWDTRNVTNLSNTFFGCSGLTNVDGLRGWDTGNVTDMKYAFYGCTSLTNVDGLSNWKTGNVTDLYWTFYNCRSLTNVDGLSGWDIGKITTLEELFYNCYSLTNVDGLEFWNTENVTNLYQTFYNCYGLTNVDKLSSWKTGNVTNMRGTFYNCNGLTNVDGLRSWKTGNVTNLYQTFYNCYGLINIDGLELWNTENVTSLYQTFYNCRLLTNVDKLSDWDTGKVTNMQSTFYDCYGLTNVDGLSEWETGNVTNMNSTFYYCNGLENVGGLSEWDTGNVTDMQELFCNCKGLTNVDGLSGWHTDKVTDFGGMFYGCENLVVVNSLKNWNTSKVTRVNYRYDGIFEACRNLKEIDLTNWDTSNITKAYQNAGFNEFFNGTSLEKITIGEKFSFKGNGITDVQYQLNLPTPPLATTTRKWVIEDRSQPSRTPAELRDDYDGATMAGTWVWETKAFKLMFESDDASGSMATVWVPIFEDYTIPANTFTKPGYDFDHWEDGGGNTYTDTDTIPANKYALDAEVTLHPVFTLREPNEIEPGLYEIELKGDEVITFTGIPGGTTYDIYEETENGWTLISSTNTNGTIQPLQTTESVFTNKYEPGTTSVQFRGTKTLDGELAAGFKFGLYEGGNLIEEVTTNASGFIEFPVIKYTEAGTHTYTIRELNQTDSTINYDTHDETITVVVTDDGEGNLSTDYDSNFSFTFENTTKPGSILLTKQRVNRDTDNFTFNVRLTKDNAPYTGDVLVGETTVTPDENGMFSVEVTDSVEISNIPAGVEYEITEEEKHGWTNTEAIGDTGTIVANWQSGVTFTNEYHASGMARLVAHKSLVGDTLSEGDYTFTLTDRYSSNILKNINNTGWQEQGLNYSNGGWSISSGGNGEMFVSEIDDSPVPDVNMSLGIRNHTTGNKDVRQDVTLEPGEEYTITGYARIPLDVESHSTTAQLRLWENNTAVYSNAFILSDHNWREFKYTFTYTGNGTARFLAGIRPNASGGTGEAIEYTGLSIVKGSDIVQTKTNNNPDMNETDADENPNPYYGTGAVIFDDIYYDESDIGKTYTYFIHEVTGTDATVTYDTHIATATVTVTDSGEGYLNTEVTYNGEVFTNEKKTGSLQLDKFTQKQGDAPEEIVETKTLATAYTDTAHVSYSNTRQIQGTDSFVTNNSGGELSTGTLTDVYNRYQCNFTKTSDRYGTAIAEWLPANSDPANFLDTIMDIGESTIEDNKARLVYIFNPEGEKGAQYMQVTLSDAFELDGDVNVYHRNVGGTALVPDTLALMYYRNPPYSNNTSQMSYLADAEYAVDGKTITVAAYNMPARGAVVVEIPIKVSGDGYTTNFATIAGTAVAKHGEVVTKPENFNVVREFNSFEPTATQMVGSPKLARMADVRDEVIGGGEYPFEFTIRLYDASGNELTDTYTATLSDGTTMSVKSGVPVTFNSNKVLTIDGLPHGATYSIEESESPGWECINEDNTNGSITANSLAHTSFTNVYSAIGETSLTAGKHVEGMDMDEFEFIVVDEDENQVSIATNDENGNIVLPLYFDMDDDGKTFNYFIKEKAGTIGDIIYDESSFPVTVTVNDNGAGEMVATVVYEDDERVFTNRRLTTLDVTKTVAGNMGDKSRSFTFTATLVGDNITYIKTGDAGVIETGDFDPLNPTFTLGHGETIHFENITYGSGYSIVEEDLPDYDVEVENDNATGNAEGQTVSFTNTRDTVVPTRSVVPGIPVWLLIAAAGGVIAGVVLKRRKKKDA